MQSRAASIHGAMVAEGFVRERDGSGRLKFAGYFDLGSRRVEVQVIFANDNLVDLPKLRLVNRGRDLPLAVAHIETGDGVCFVGPDDLQLDPLRPRPTVALLLAKMREALGRIASSDLSADIQAEFPQHWMGANVLVDLSATFAGVGKLLTLRRGGTSQLLLAEKAQALRRLGISKETEREIVISVQDVPVLRLPRVLGFVPGRRRPETLAQLREWANELRQGLWSDIVSAVTGVGPNCRTFFLTASNGTIGASVIFPVATKIVRREFLAQQLTQGNKAAVSRLSGVRVDADFIYSRNLVDQPNFAGLSIGLIGAGSIGGHLAKFLAQAGVGLSGGTLTIFDPQEFAPGNVGRHLLGVQAVGQNKAAACKLSLLQTYPDNRIEAVDRSALDRAQDLFRFDLVINASGEQALADVLAERWAKARAEMVRVPPVLHGWLEGNGVAAQALLTEDGTDACARCLRTRDGVARFKVIRVDHPAILTPANCGEGAYFAYGPGAPAIAAGLMVQMALDWRRGSADPKLRTLRIVHDATHVVKDQTPSRLADCPACGS